MTKQEITSIALKIFALYLLANILYTLPSSYIILNMVRRLDDGQMTQFWLGGLSLCLTGIGVVIAFMLWKLANSLISSREGKNNHGAPSLSAESLEPIILSAAGAFIAISTFSHLGRLVSNSLLYANLKKETGIPTSDIMNMVIDIIVFGLGVSLIIKAKWWINLFKRYR